MKKVTSATVWNDSAGRRLSVTYSEIDEATHKTVKDNVRENYILVTAPEISASDAVLIIAQELLDGKE